MAGLEDVASAVNELAGKVAALIALEAIRGGLTREQFDAAIGLANSMSPAPFSHARPAPASVAIETLNKIASVSASLATVRAAGQQENG